jgi:hypothetical protein
MSEDMTAELPCVLVEGPGPGDAQFLGRWLVAAAGADQTLQNRFAENPSLKQQISRLELVYWICFSSAATKFVELLMKNLTCFSLPLDEDWGDIADARFLGQWLLAAAEADTLLQAQFEQDRSFKRWVSRILLLHQFAFSPDAI